MAEDKEFPRAKKYAYRLLSSRQRTVGELTSRLEEKGFSPAVIEKTVDDLIRQGYLDDEKFALAWIENKIQTAPVGQALLRDELRRRGITEEILEKAVSDFTARHSEYETAMAVAAAQRKCYPGIDSAGFKKKLYACLNRRGFSPEVIEQVIETG